MSGFEGFRESPDAPFYRSGGRTPEATWPEAADRLARVIDDIRRQPGTGPPINVERIRRWHRAVFVTTFERDAGRLRDDGEPVWFSVLVETTSGRGRRPIEGARGRGAIVRELTAACNRFNAEHEELAARPARADHSEALAAAAAIYVAVLGVHPFVDGNLRAGFVALQAALRALDFPGVVFGEAVRRHDEAVGWALRGDEAASLEPLVDLLSDLVAI